MQSSFQLVLLFFILIFLIAILGVFIYYYYRLQELLKLVQPQNRALEPGLVWLMLIPCFNLIWRFILVDRISESLRNEYLQRGIWNKEAKPTNSKGMLMAGFAAAGLIPYIGLIFSLVAFIFWILYWIEIEEHMKTLKHNTINSSALDDPTLFIEE